MKYYIDYKSGIILKDIDETRVLVSDDIEDRDTHIIRLNEDQTAYYLENPSSNLYDVFYMTLWQREQEDPYERLQIAKHNLVCDLEEYDKSVNVNLFYVNDTGAWLDRSTRCALMNSIITTKSLGKNEMSLWLNGEKYVLGVNDLANMLCLLEDYAMECYGVTETHRANILAIESEEELIAYDYKANYPKKLEFEV